MTKEDQLKQLIREGKERLETQFDGTRQAIELISAEAVRHFMRDMDRGLNPDEIQYLNRIITRSMSQAFCYGYCMGRSQE